MTGLETWTPGGLAAGGTGFWSGPHRGVGDCLGGSQGAAGGPVGLLVVGLLPMERLRKYLVNVENNVTMS